jgi:hypothetical protein
VQTFYMGNFINDTMLYSNLREYCDIVSSGYWKIEFNIWP